MNKQKSSFMSIGIPSMCIIFSVLCLVILALLTFGTSRQDLQTSRLTLEQTTAYYTACSTASQKYQKLADYSRDAFTGSKNSMTYNTKMKAIISQYPDVTWNQKTQTLSFTIDFTDEQAIYIEVIASYPVEALSINPQILTWKTISTADWNPDTKQPVYKGDTK